LFADFCESTLSQYYIKGNQRKSLTVRIHLPFHFQR
jgi:hypothetical protein